MGSMSFADHYSEGAEAYAASRPTYPPDLIRHLASLAPGRELAWDCATGSGQAARLLAAHFRRVIATDASLRQISHAPADPRVAYRVGREDDSGEAAGSVDLVTVAQALHWLDLPRFYREADRVLKPGGLFAAWCYGRMSIAPDVDPVLEWFYSERVGPFWPPERRLVESGYREIELPYAEIPSGPWRMTARLSRQQVLGYVGTWSAVARAHSAEGRDPLPELEAALAPVWPSPAEVLEVAWPLAVRVGRKP